MQLVILSCIEIDNEHKCLLNIVIAIIHSMFYINSNKYTFNIAIFLETSSARHMQYKYADTSSRQNYKVTAVLQTCLTNMNSMWHRIFLSQNTILLQPRHNIQ